ncbi:beta strand repeat-containing protein [Mycolicibacterium sphagni]|uniref:beta strand repeat-containing protein n=1 Tax=Mycolicibacterium sphagni TaxID=1786 RepID=UPI0021F289B7|nr:Ig-like domain-containing protein [Mycolicibacterium sphagni]
MVGLGSTQIPVGNGGAYDVPTDATSTVGAQNPTTGVVTGAVSFVDPAAKPLTYTVTTNGTEGSATVTSSGAFTYTPDTATTTTTDTFTVTATNAAGKTATEIVTVPVRVTDTPVAGTPTVGTPNATTGVVTGTLNFTDPAGSPLTYTVSSNGSQGTAVVASTGTFTYISSGNTTASTDTFTVTATNAFGNSATESVTVPVSSVTGTTTFSNDGTYALVSRYVGGTPNNTTYYALINTTTGTQVGSTITITGQVDDNFNPTFSTDDSHVLIGTWSTNGAISGDTNTTTYTVLSTTTGAVTATINLDGASAGAPTFSSNGTYALVSSYVGGTTNNTTYYALINTTTGTQVGSTITITGQVDDNFNPTFSTDNSHVLIGTWSTNGATSGDTNTTTYTVLSTTTGAVTATINLDGASAGAPTFSSNGTYALVSSYVGGTPNNTTRYALVDLLTGAQIGTTVNITGQADDNFNPTFSTDNSNVLIGTWSTNGATSGDTNTTTYTVLSTTTGAVTATINLDGASAGPPTFNTNDTYALLSSYVGATTNNTTRYVLINTLTGAQIGTTLNITGQVDDNFNPTFSTDNSHVLIGTWSTNGATSGDTNTTTAR